MKINYIITDADEVLVKSVIEQINKENESRQYSIGYPLTVKGKMLKSDIDENFTDYREHLSRIIYGYVTCFWGNGEFTIRLFLIGKLYEFIQESLNNNNISFILIDDDSDEIGDIEIPYKGNDIEVVSRWLDNFSIIVENSKEFKKFISNIEKYRLIG